MITLYSTDKYNGLTVVNYSNSMKERESCLIIHISLQHSLLSPKLLNDKTFLQHKHHIIANVLLLNDTMKVDNKKRKDLRK